MCSTQTWTSIAAVASAIFSFCIVLLTCRQKKIQEDNYKLSLFKERFRAVEPILLAYSYFEGGLNQLIEGFLSESKDSSIPERGYVLKKDLHETTVSFSALFDEKVDVFNQFIKDYDSLLGSAKIMCQNIPKKQSGNEQMDLHYFLFERTTQKPISKEELIKGFPKAAEFIDDFCRKQSSFIEQYLPFILFLKDKVMIK